MEEISDERIAQLYKGGMAQYRIAEKLGIGKTAVRNALIRQNVPLRKYTAPPKEPSERDKAIAKLYWENYGKPIRQEGTISPREIGEMYGISRQAVINIANSRAGQQWKPKTSKSAKRYTPRNGGRFSR